MAVAEELIVRIRADADKAIKDLNSLEKQTGKSQGGFKKFTSFIKSTGVGSFLAVGAAIAGVTKFLSDSEKAARDAQEIFSKYDFVFESMGSAAETAANEFATSFGLADSTAKKLLGTTGDLLVGMGATEGQALDLATEVNALAADLASFSNIEGGTERASHALTAALLGEREQAKMLGVVIREADVQQKLMERGQQDLTGQALLLAKAQVTLELATQQSQKAIGDYARTSESAANVSRRAEEATTALKEAVGASVVEAVTPFKRAWAEVATQLADVINKQRELTEANKAIDNGTASIEQQLIALEAERDELAAASDEFAEFMYGGVDQRDSQLDKINAAIAAIKKWQAVEEHVNNEERSAAQARAEEAVAEAKAAEERAKDLQALNDEWANTKAGQIAATEEAIKYFESFIQTDKVKAVLSDLYDKLEDLKKIEGEASKETEFAIASMVAGYGDMSAAAEMVAENKKKLHEEELERIEKEIELRQELAGYMVDSAFEVASAWATTYAGLSGESEKAAKLQASIAKAQALYQIAVSTFTAATKALELGPILGPAAASFITGLGIANAAAVLSEPMPALAEGGIVTKPTTALIGEAGPEAVVPLGSGGFGNTTVHIYGTMVMQDQVEAFIARVNSKNNRGY